MPDPQNPQPERRKMKLARELIQRGLVRRPGETVELRPDQIDRLRPEGYFDEKGATI